MRFFYLIVACLTGPFTAEALECPAMPRQAQRDWDMAIAVAVNKLDKAAGPQLQAQTRSTTTDLLRRLPGADRVYLEQMMYATYCSSLRDNAALSEVERNTRVQAYNRELRATLNGAARSVAADPRDAARAELARVPVEYTPAAFVEAARDNKTALVRLFVQAGIDPNPFDDDGNTALMYFAGRGDIALINLLLKARADINARSRRYGSTALAWAAAEGKVETMQLLLKAGAAENSFDYAFFLALREGRIDAMRVLLDHGLSLSGEHAARGVDITGARMDRAPLADLLALLRQRGWPVDAADGNGETALMRAAVSDNTALMTLLLDAGAPVDQRSPDGRTALFRAAEWGRLQAATLLLAAGAAVDAPSDRGTPLMMAVDSRREETVLLLLRKGADVKKARLSNGATALMVAAGSGDVGLLTPLLGAGAEVNERGGLGETALMWAADSGRIQCARTLLDAGADVNLANKFGITPLMAAAGNGRFETTRLLVRRGARPDLQDAEGRSSLDHAVQRLNGDDLVRMRALLASTQRKDGT
jgi:ankyrin repeat protein